MRLWAIILAAGVGSRLAALTRALHGQAVAKQFAVIVGADTLVQRTVERILPLVPEERILVVVGPGQEASAGVQLARWPGIELVAQPRDLDTGPGLLLPLVMVRARDRSARVVVLPADHHVVRPDELLDAVDLALAATIMFPDELCLLGAVPDAAESERDWILPGASLDLFGLHTVGSIVEEVVTPQGDRIHRMGGLVNTLAMVASVDRLWGLARTHLAQHLAAIESCVIPWDPPIVNVPYLDAVYRSLWPASFGRAMLQPGAMSVLPVSGAGWSDWDTPRQVFQSLKGTAELNALLARLARAPQSSRTAMNEDIALCGDERAGHQVTTW